MKIRIAGISNDSIVDGEGIRFTVFVQGCLRGCVGCHNPQTHDILGGYDAEIDDLIAQMRENDILTGLTISGGEPFYQPKECAELARRAHEIGLDVWVYTGYTYENLLSFCATNPHVEEFLNEVDMLVDGEFRIDEKTFSAPWRGSWNQRLIDLKGKRNHEN